MINVVGQSAADLVVNPETPVSTVAWIQDQLIGSGVRQVHVRTREQP